jgi:hypothetical protein
MDIWIAIQPHNASRVVAVLKDFGFDVPGLSPDLFLKEGQIIRMGEPPLRIEIATTISGVKFDECFAERKTEVFDGVPVNIISLKHLKVNKQASGRYKDLNDLENLP